MEKRIAPASSVRVPRITAQVANRRQSRSVDLLKALASKKKLYAHQSLRADYILYTYLKHQRTEAFQEKGSGISTSSKGDIQAMLFPLPTVKPSFLVGQSTNIVDCSSSAVSSLGNTYSSVSSKTKFKSAS